MVETRPGIAQHAKSHCVHPASQTEWQMDAHTAAESPCFDGDICCEKCFTSSTWPRRSRSAQRSIAVVPSHPQAVGVETPQDAAGRQSHRPRHFTCADTTRMRRRARNTRLFARTRHAQIWRVARSMAIALDSPIVQTQRSTRCTQLQTITGACI